MNEMNKTENEAVKRMNETEKSQTEESEWINECPINLIREESQEREKSPNCLTKRDLQKIHAQKIGEWENPRCHRKIKFYNLWVQRLFFEIFKNVKAMD